MRPYIALAMSCALSACGSLHLYNKSADQLATSAKAAYADGKVADALKVEHANLDALEKRELEAFSNVLTVRRDLDLLSLMADASTPFAERFTTLTGNRLLEISGKEASVLETKRKVMAGARIRLGTVAKGEAKARDTFMLLDSKLNRLPVCNKIEEVFLKEPSLEVLRKLINDVDFNPLPTLQLETHFQGYAKQCLELKTARAAVIKAEADLSTGSLAQARDNAMKQADDLKARETKAKGAKEALNQATESEAVARKQKDAAAAHVLNLTCNDNADKSAAPNPICDAIGKLKELGNLGIKTISEQQIESIDLALAALSGTATSEEEAKLPAGLALLSTNVRLADALHRYRTAGKLPALEPLIIERQLASAKLKLATQLVELEQLRVSLAQEIYDALWLELNLLVQARAHLGGFPANAGNCSGNDKPPRCLNVSALASSRAKATNGEPVGRVAFRALSLLSDSYSVARARAESAGLRLVLGDYRESLIASEGAVAAWDALVAAPLAQLQAYHAGGVKTEDIAHLLQALGVVGIAARID